MAEPDFASALSALCAKELSAGHKDAGRFGIMIERLVYSLALTIATAGHGKAGQIDELVTGASAYLLETAVDLAPFAAMMEHGRRGR